VREREFQSTDSRVESGSRGTNSINKGGSVRERSSDPSIPEWSLDREARTESIKEAV
jgi:hypothetical protein